MMWWPVDQSEANQTNIFAATSVIKSVCYLNYVLTLPRIHLLDVAPCEVQEYANRKVPSIEVGLL